MRKSCSSDRDKLLKFEAEGRELAKFLRSLEQFFQTLKGQNIFGNMQEKLENILTSYALSFVFDSNNM